MKNLFVVALAIVLFNSFQYKAVTCSQIEFMRADSVYLSEKSAESGDLYKTIGHHGPAIENEWLGLRIYFSHKVAIDVYNKAKPGLELKEVKWYPTDEQQKDGWGADYYKAGNTVGLGGVRLWDGTQVVSLNPVTNRTARVVKEKTSSYMEMLNEGVPYKDTTIDILVRVTVYSGIREAKVEAFALTDQPVQFVTGINYHNGQEIKKEEGLIATWGLHPEDVAAESIKLGAALIYNPEDYVQELDDGTQILFISKPAKQLTTWISSACEKEEGVGSMEEFLQIVNN
jgi:hypothetical protein